MLERPIIEFSELETIKYRIIRFIPIFRTSVVIKFGQSCLQTFCDGTRNIITWNSGFKHVFSLAQIEKAKFNNDFAFAKDYPFISDSGNPNIYMFFPSLVKSIRPNFFQIDTFPFD